MKFFEYEAKQVYARFDIPIPHGVLVANKEQVKDAVAKLKQPYVVKAQVLSGGRGKAGGILFADDADEAAEATAKLLEMKISGSPVHQVLVEEKLEYVKELFLSITVDRLNRTYVVLTSEAGGVEIEETAKTTPQAIIKTLVDPQLGIRDFHAMAAAQKLGYKGSQLAELTKIIAKLYQALIDSDAELVEINPLAETSDGRFVALDARLTIDDNALFRHPDYQTKAEERKGELLPQERLALQKGLAYVKLDGNIGVIGNGAGLVMATLDLINHFGGRPANFLDLGGGATLEQIDAAIEIVNSNANVKALLINILGGLTHCDVVAKAIVETAKAVGTSKPLVVRLVGTNEKEGKKILWEAGIEALDSMEQAARQAVKVAGERTPWG